MYAGRNPLRRDSPALRRRARRRRQSCIEDRNLRPRPQLGPRQQPPRRPARRAGADPAGFRLQPHRPRRRQGRRDRGFITPAAEPAYYGEDIGRTTFDDRCGLGHASAVADGGTHVLLGFFNADTRERVADPEHDRPPHQRPGRRVLRLRRVLHRAMAGRRRQPAAVRHASRTRRPAASRARGFRQRRRPPLVAHVRPERQQGRAASITATIDGETAVCNLTPGHKADGATFNRFGLLTVMKSADGGGEVWLDDVTVNGETDDFDRRPPVGRDQQPPTYEHDERPPAVRLRLQPPPGFAGGQAAGELGGLVFRGDCRYPERLACYGDRVGPLTLDKPLKAVRQGRPAPRRHRQHDPLRLLPLRAQPAR